MKVKNSDNMAALQISELANRKLDSLPNFKLFFTSHGGQSVCQHFVHAVVGLHEAVASTPLDDCAGEKVWV